VARYGLFGSIVAHPGQRDALLRELTTAAGQVAQLPGCEVWIVNTSPDDPDRVWVYEVWRSREDHAASLTEDDVKATIERARPWIAGFGERTTLDPIVGKGLADTP
jgi:quinol monooxygenase YgiN